MTDKPQPPETLSSILAEHTFAHAQPTRQDGDGLLPCPFCGGLDLTVYKHQSVGSWVACVDCGLETPTETGTTPDGATKYLNTRATPSPTRDAAEGAGQKSTSAAVRESNRSTPRSPASAAMGHCAEVDTAAPPKPAPDAMHRALKRLREYAATWGPEDDTSRPSLHDDLILVCDAVSSAPVPPADGAVTFAQHLDRGGTLDPALTARMDAIGRDLSASAEPVVRYSDLQLGGGGQYTAATLAAEIERMATDETVRPFDDLIEENWKTIVAALRALPTVRGERELLEQCAKIARQFELDMSKSQLDDRDIENIQRGANDASNAIADAILSLPVQSGAGER